MGNACCVDKNDDDFNRGRGPTPTDKRRQSSKKKQRIQDSVANLNMTDGSFKSNNRTNDGSMKSRTESANQSISTNFNVDDSVKDGNGFWVRQPSKIPKGEYGELDKYYIIKTIGKGGFGKVKIGFEKTTR